MKRKDLKQCDFCKYYEPYYIKHTPRFLRTINGICRRTQSLTPHCDTCEFWQDNHSQRQYENETNFERLKKIADSLEEIAQIMKEEQEINKLDPL